MKTQEISKSELMLLCCVLYTYKYYIYMYCTVILIVRNNYKIPFELARICLSLNELYMECILFGQSLLVEINDILMVF